MPTFKILLLCPKQGLSSFLSRHPLRWWGNSFRVRFFWSTLSLNKKNFFFVFGVFRGPNSKHSSDSESWHFSAVQDNVGTPKSHPRTRGRNIRWGFTFLLGLNEWELVAATKPQGGGRSRAATSAMLTALAGPRWRRRRLLPEFLIIFLPKNNRRSSAGGGP